MFNICGSLVKYIGSFCIIYVGRLYNVSGSFVKYIGSVWIIYVGSFVKYIGSFLYNIFGVACILGVENIGKWCPRVDIQRFSSISFDFLATQ